MAYKEIALNSSLSLPLLGLALDAADFDAIIFFHAVAIALFDAMLPWISALALTIHESPGKRCRI